jgi:4-hydroxythreonine-4-phosphate dehydrogenase
MANVKRILLTPGEPAGIGPDITLTLATKMLDVEIVAVADPDLLITRAAALNLPVAIQLTDGENKPTPHQKNQLQVIPVKLAAKVKPGQLDVRNAPYVIQTLEKAIALCLQNKAHALTTGPVQKSILNEAGIPFTGHTEFLAEKTGAGQVLMLFVVDTLRVALATVHIPLQQVATAVSEAHLIQTLTLFADSLQKMFNIANPKIFVAGLNPHAGEMGYLGREELDTIIPAIQSLNARGYAISGPYPADTLFTPHLLAKADGILAMYHDQALPVIKHIGFERAVNITLGLPIIRTSVDHGTALDLAGTGKADASSLVHAVNLAKVLRPSFN